MKAALRIIYAILLGGGIALSIMFGYWWFWVGLVAWWVVAGPICYACEFAYWQREFDIISDRDYAKDRQRSFMTALLAPISVVVIYELGLDRYGMKWR